LPCTPQNGRLSALVIASIGTLRPKCIYHFIFGLLVSCTENAEHAQADEYDLYK
jgi:hypothetical protein